MAKLRLILIGMLAACRSSAADPGSGLTPPASWTALPDLATEAASAATRDGITVDGAEAWAEPARGCYAAWLALAGASGPADVLAQQMVASLSADPALAGIVIHDVVKPGDAPPVDGDVLTLAFERAVYRGMLRANIGGDGHIRVLACFWNQREPVACEKSCTALLGALR